MGRGARGIAGEREEYDIIMYWMDGWEESKWRKLKGKRKK